MSSSHEAIAALDAEIARREDELATLHAARQVIAGSTGGGRAMAPDAVVAPSTAPKRLPPPRNREDDEVALTWELAGHEFTLAEKPARLMAQMSGGDIVSKETLMQAVGAVGNLQFYPHLRALKQALEDAAPGHTIETVRGQGYRIVACAEE